MKCKQAEQKAGWYLMDDEHARLNIDRQAERNGECGK